jgi:DNA polymerase-3 subunit gamma/tau
MIRQRWRPQRVSEFVRQESIVRTLENAIRLKKIAYAFLFIRPRGTGKTSTARLRAIALNAPEQLAIDTDPNSEPCRSGFEGHCMHVIEIDGASNIVW